MLSVGDVGGGDLGECLEKALLGVTARQFRRYALPGMDGIPDPTGGAGDVLVFDYGSAHDDDGRSRLNHQRSGLRGHPSRGGHRQGGRRTDGAQYLRGRGLTPHLLVDAHVHTDIGGPHGLGLPGPFHPVGDVHEVHHDLRPVLPGRQHRFGDGGIIGQTHHRDHVRSRFDRNLDFKGAHIHGLGVGHDLVMGELLAQGADAFRPFALQEGGADLDPVRPTGHAFLGDGDCSLRVHQVQGDL